MKAEDKVVILTGATQGIGLATSHLLAEAGCKMVLAARSEPDLEILASGLVSEGRSAIAISTNMSDTGQAVALAQATVEAYGTIDVVINNAAIGVRDDVVHLSEGEARYAMDVNYFGPLALIQASIPHLKNNRDGGLIINISSIVGRRAMPGIAAYSASKAALEKMAESLRIELVPDNIRISTVYPGITATQFNAHSLGSDPRGRGQRSGVPPERVARTILKTIQHEQRDVFVTLFDRAFVTASMLLPGTMDWLLRNYTSRRNQVNPTKLD
jgi:short-subunit dehydrogenase